MLTDDVSRQGIIDAFKKRHCYAATDNILLDVRCGDHLMGDVFEHEASGRRSTSGSRAPRRWPRSTCIRNNKYVYTGTPNKQEVTLRYTDDDAPAGKASYYYVRIEQADGNLAWASPMWITFKP